MKASFHASGRCHVRAPSPESWKGAGTAPRYLDTWQFDVESNYQFPFSVVVPEPELRAGDWANHRDKGTIWVEAAPREGIEVALFFVRANGDLGPNLAAAGWHTKIVETALPDGRLLVVAAGPASVPAERVEELEAVRTAAQAVLARRAEVARNPRMLLFTGPNENGTRKFIEAAVQRAA